MGKETFVQIPVNRPQTTRLKRIFVIAFALAAALWLFALSDIFFDDDSSNFTGCQSPSSNTKPFQWNKVTPSEELHWIPCYPGFQCARLKVPLNYENLEDGSAAIALIRYPAKVNRAHGDYKGPVLFNPGGPGGSGVLLVLSYGPHFQDLLGDDYDIIGFDPRGIGRTTPVVDIFNSPLERLAWELRNADAPFANETSTAVVELVARARLINALIAEKVPVAAEHANTAVVCRDMLSIVRAHGFEKLQYWGFSYGSVLGASFAALFPDNVGRLIIDGVVDAANYYAGLWDNNLRVADKGLETIFEQCAESGKDCPLHESTADKVRGRYVRLIDTLERKPVTVHKGGAGTIITKRMVRGMFFGVLYRPYRAAKDFFTALNALEQGNGLPLYELGEGAFAPLKCDCDSKPPLPTGGQEGQSAVMCTDAGPVDYDLDEFQRHFERLAKASYFGDIWTQIRLGCVDWKVKAKNPWRGPVTGNTSFPVLLIGNTEDPVTPDAKKMARAFPGSVVLTQRSAGHCSLAAVSLCTAKAIRAYFREGILPAKGTVCEIEDHMFRNVTTEALLSLSQEDARIMETVRQINQDIRFDHILR